MASFSSRFLPPADCIERSQRIPEKSSGTHRGKRSYAARLRRSLAREVSRRHSGDNLRSGFSRDNVCSSGHAGTPGIECDSGDSVIVKHSGPKFVQDDKFSDILRSPSSLGVRGESRTASKRQLNGDFSLPNLSAQQFSVWFINARSLNSLERRGIVQHYLDMHRPEIFGVVETWLDEHSCKYIDFPNYTLVHRRDRPDARPGHSNHGGIILFRRSVNAPLVTFLEESRIAELLWARVETNFGPFLLGLWYRPPDASDEHVSALESEFERLSGDYVGALLCGDFNIHQRRWLRHSNSNTALGERVQQFAGKHGLAQLVRQPTHVDGNLLDLVLSSLPFCTSCATTPRIADHNGVLATIDVPVFTESVCEREVCDFKKADWDRLRSRLESHDWSFLDIGTVDDVASQLTASILDHCRYCIPIRVCKEKRKSHPWMTDRCANALAMRASFENSDGYDDACRRCGDVLRDEFRKHVDKIRAKLTELPPSSKDWWRVSGELLDNVVPRCGVPSLRTSDGQWLHENVDKANLFAECFVRKSALPPEITDLDVGDPVSEMKEFVAVRTRMTARILKDLREDQATGPDKLGARVLRRCAAQLVRPITVLARRILNEGVWPRVWKMHWVSPLHKRGSVFDPEKYRGLHLTPVISKVVERCFAAPLSTFCSETCAFGRTQWAFQKQIGCKDLICTLLARWLLAFQSRNKVGIYLSDISGAFDRVHRPRLLRKLCRAGFNRKFLALFSDFLDVREAIVVIGGASSDPYILENMVFQGTVLGPILWNIFFADVSDAVVAQNGFVDTKFADDLSACKEFANETANSDIMGELHACQTRVHNWGVQNRVIFDAGKEEFCILDPSHGVGRPFRLLGPIIDPKLRMHECVDKVYKRAKPKARRLLLAARFFTQRDLVKQFKAHIWGVIESVTAAVYHAAPSTIAKLDRVQSSFVEKIGLTERQAFLWYGMHPLVLRRDVAMLGVLYKCGHQIAHPDLLELFPRVSSARIAQTSTRRFQSQHSRQLLLRHHGDQRMEFHRSIFGLVKIWNVLPSAIVESEDIPAFQRALTDIARKACESDCPGWSRVFSPPTISPVLLRMLLLFRDES